MKKLIFIISLWFSISIQAATISYSVHVAEIGWMDWVSNASMAGTTGQGRRMEAIKINTEGLPASCGLIYQSHLADSGWQDWVTSGVISGTTGENRRMEAIKIRLTSCDGWRVQYQTHVAELGWLDWVFDGEISGTVGESRQIEAIRIGLVKTAQTESPIQNLPPDWQIFNFDHPFFGVVHVPEKHRFYVVQGDDEILELDESTLRVSASYTIPGALRLTSLAYENSHLWVGDIRGTKKVYKLNLSSLAVSSINTSSRHPDGIGTDGTYIYLVSNDKSGLLYILNPSNGENTGSLTTAVPDPVGITFDGSRLLVLDESGRVYGVDKLTGDTTYLFSAPETIDTNSPYGPESITYFETLGIFVIGYGYDNKIAFGASPNRSGTVYVLLHGYNSSVNGAWTDLVTDNALEARLGDCENNKISTFNDVYITDSEDLADLKAKNCYAYEYNKSGIWEHGDGSTYANLKNELRNLVDAIDSVRKPENIMFIAHSKGGLNLRAYLQGLSEPKPFKIGMLTIDTPHQGSPLGRMESFLRNAGYTSGDIPTQETCPAVIPNQLLRTAVMSPATSYLAQSFKDGRPFRNTVSAVLWDNINNDQVSELGNIVDNFGQITSAGIYLGDNYALGFDLFPHPNEGWNGAEALAVNCLVYGNVTLAENLRDYVFENLTDIYQEANSEFDYSMINADDWIYGDGIVPEISQRLDLVPEFNRKGKPLNWLRLHEVKHTKANGRTAEIKYILDVMEANW